MRACLRARPSSGASPQAGGYRSSMPPLRPHALLLTWLSESDVAMERVCMQAWDFPPACREPHDLCALSGRSTAQLGCQAQAMCVQACVLARMCVQLPAVDLQGCKLPWSRDVAPILLHQLPQ